MNLLLKRISIVAGIAFLWNALSRFIPAWLNGYLILLHALVVTGCGMYFLLNDQGRSDRIGKACWILITLGFIVWGASDFLWGLNYFILGRDGHTGMAIAVTGVCSTAFVLFSIGILLATRKFKQLLFKDTKTTLLAIVGTTFLYVFLFYSKLRFSSLVELDVFTWTEVFAILAGYVLLNLCVLLFISGRNLDWTLFAAGLINLVLGDNAIRINKHIVGNEHFNVNSLLVVAGLYSSLVALSYGRKDQMMALDGGEPFIRNKASKLFFAFTVGAILSLLLLDSSFAPILCPAFGFAAFYSAFDSYFQAIQEEKLRLQEIDMMFKVQRQISHDVGPAIDTLKLIIRDLQLSSERKAVALGALCRVSDTVKTPLKKCHNYFRSVGEHLSSTPSSIQIQTDIFLKNLLELMVAEKRIKYQNRPDLEIQCEIDKSAYTHFLQGTESDLARAISNLIDNSADAIPSHGRITVSLKGQNDYTVIRITDTGTGIPKEILPNIGKVGFSYGKASGSGLGLNQVYDTVRNLSGTLNILSTPGVGTTIELSFKQGQLPSWFTPKITFESGSHIVILDDDIYMHQIWKNRFEKFDSVIIHHCYSEQDFEITLDQLKGKNTTFLCDYELRDSAATGLELIKKHQLETRSYLVSGRFEESFIREQCVNSKIALVPKTLAHDIELHAIARTKPKTPFTEAILIDDNSMSHHVWRSSAEKRGIHLSGFYSVDEFLSNESSFIRSTPIFIDFHLGRGLLGTNESKKLKTLGFERIFLSTSDEAASIEVPSHIEAIVEKLPPWERERS